jgi:hypothetical protein
MSTNVTVKLDEARIKDKIEHNARFARLWLKNEVAKDTAQFVPYRLGGLRASVEPSIDRDDNKLVYDVPYAHRLYYSRGYRFSRIGTTDHWFEKAKAIYRDKWLRGVRKIGGYR